MTVIDPKYRDSVATFASPQAIEVHLKKAHAALSRARREVEWLEALQQERAEQVAAGLWPTNPTEAQERWRGDAAPFTPVQHVPDRSVRRGWHPLLGDSARLLYVGGR